MASSDDDDEFAALLEGELEGDAGGGGADESDEPPAKRARGGEGVGGGEGVVGCAHPAFLGDLCVACGFQRTEGAVRGLSLRHVHADLDVSADECARLRAADRERAQRGRKLQLVLDLDHTLLNSERRALLSEELTADLEALVRGGAEKGSDGGAQVDGRGGEGGYALPPGDAQPTVGGGEDAGAAKANGGRVGAQGGGIADGDDNGDDDNGGGGDGVGAGEQASTQPGGVLGMEASSLYDLAFMGMWTKLRPGAADFLHEAAKMYELSVYTMGARAYAEQMARILDPRGVLFQGRIISVDDSTSRRTKSTDVVLADDRMVVIVDDTAAVWPTHARNLFNVDRYHFFPSSRQVAARGERVAADPGARPQMDAVLESRQDESADEGQLATVLGVLREAHAAYFEAAAAGQVADVREALSARRARVLAGVTLLFTRVVPLGQRVEDHPLVHIAVQLGAAVAHAEGAEVTHVVAGAAGTSKAKWGAKAGKRVVSPKWLWACHFGWRRCDEAAYPPADDD